VSLMPDFHSHISLPYTYPRNLTVAQFLLDEASHPLRPTRLAGSPWLIDDASGRSYSLEEIRERVERVARAAKTRWGLGPGDVVCLYSQNHIDYAIVIWAMHRLGCTITPANPAYTAGELEYQLKESSAKLLFTTPTSLSVALEAASRAKLFGPGDVVVFSPPPPEAASDGTECFPSALPLEGVKSAEGAFITVQQLVIEGWMLDKNYSESHGSMIGETAAFLCFSSGTTGLPKAIAIAHRGVIAVMMQMAAALRSSDSSIPMVERCTRPGDRAIAAVPFYHIYGLVAVVRVAQLLHYSMHG